MRKRKRLRTIRDRGVVRGRIRTGSGEDGFDVTWKLTEKTVAEE